MIHYTAVDASMPEQLQQYEQELRARAESLSSTGDKVGPLLAQNLPHLAMVDPFPDHRPTSKSIDPECNVFCVGFHDAHGN